MDINELVGFGGLGKECRLTVFGNRILRRIFGPKKDVTGQWRRLHNNEGKAFEAMAGSEIVDQDVLCARVICACFFL